MILHAMWPTAFAFGCSGEPAAPIDPDFEGIEEVAEGLTDLSSQCTFNATSGQMTLALASGDVALVAKANSGLVVINGYACGGATGTTLKKLVVTGSSGAETLIVDFMNGYFAPGISAAVGIDVDLGGGTDALKFRGGKTADAFVFGASGITFNGDTFKDVAVANVETYVVTMSDGADTFSGAGSTPTGTAFTSAVTVYGGAGADTLRGGAGADTLYGGDDADTFTTGATADGGDVMVGGAGADTADYSARTAALTITVDGMADDGGASEGDDVQADIETVKGGTGNDTITGSTGNDTIYGGAGDDTITGNDGDDVLYGDAGNDTFDEEDGDSGSDTMNGGAGTDTADYSARTNAVVVNISNATADDGETGEADKVVNDVENVIGGDGGDTITGSTSDNVLDGGAGNDTISGGFGNDTLKGGAGSNTLNGDAGDDVFDQGAAADGDDAMRGGTGIDLVDYSARVAAVTVVMDGTTTGGASGEADVVFTDCENLKGGAEADTLTGNAFDNQIEGGAEVDTIDGLAGDDVIDGNAGDDVVDCGAGDADILLDTTTDTVANCEL